MVCDLVASFKRFTPNVYTFSGARNCPYMGEHQSLLTICPEGESTSAMWIRNSESRGFYSPSIYIKTGKYTKFIALTLERLRSQNAWQIGKKYEILNIFILF